MYNTTSRAPIDELSKNSDVEEKTDTVEDVAGIDTEPIASKDLGRIAIIGKGPYGVAMIDALLRTGHDVLLGVRTPAGSGSVGSVELFHPDYAIHHHLQKDVARQRIRTVPDAISQADVVVVCIPCTSHTRFVKENAAILRRRGAEKLNSGGTGIVMIDIRNTRQHDQDSSVAEQLQAALMAECLTSRISHSYVSLVKAFNTVSELPQKDMLRSEDAVPVCGNDITAKNTAMNLGSGIGLRPFDIGNLDNARQMEANGYSNWSKWGRAAIAIFIILTFFLVYCTLWYMVFDSPIPNAPVYTWDQPALVINKACSNTALTLLAVTYLPGKLAHIHQIIRKDCNKMLPFYLPSWLQIRNQLGITAGWFMVVHTALTMALTTPNISEQQSFSQLKNLLAQITLLIGVVAACLWLPVTLSPVPAIRQGLSVRKWKFLHNTIAHTALVVAGAHGMMFWLAMYVCPVDVLHLILTIGRVKRVHGDRSGKVSKEIITKSMAKMRGKTDSKWHKEMAQGLVALAFAYSGEDGGLNHREFITAFSDLPAVYVNRLFQALDIDESGWVGMETMLPIFLNDHPVLSFYE
ncbi:hypothetical protein SARC_11202 [Sphaeroforma arctica JP610]|uniref:EF-hand domain-containing protein n=1 Tax=Sphaeroforma arctica JP610 TaxID=667725 RepID=A0A0L0FHQ5_9EUKA|nr:hypothetical protein SARC_11202 [Sphaeroforma arctica JP610]KNC76285.1 hypothetical protein SARC_11202 [Sphaeroforma arctica JP610]|eukprot:XP_014150187.1 hypothetical protein SARC_11202 [Sphaeroforma arctica JP610]